MAKQETLLARKRRGPSPTGKGFTVGVRLQPDQLAALDAYIARQPEPKPSRPEAIRRVIMGAISRKPDWPDMST
jgi:hypothetical protein